MKNSITIIRLFLKSVFWFSVGVLAMVFITELLFRATRSVTPAFNQVDEQLGRSRRPGLFWVVFNEGFSMGRFNRYGYNGPGYPLEKGKDVVRVALLGDSYVEGYQVFDRHHFRSVLEEHLNSHLPDSVEVLNFGRNGFNFKNIYVYHHNLVEQFDPDFTVIFLSANDLGREHTDHLLPAVVVSDSVLQIVHAPGRLMKRYRALEKLTHHAYLLNMLNSARKQAASVSVAEILLDKFYSGLHRDPPDDATAGFYFSLTERLILHELAAGKRLLIADTDNTLPAQFKSLCLSLGVPVIPVGEIVERRAPAGHYWAVTGETGHWNHDAHNVVANVLRHAILKEWKGKSWFCD
jgi:lysophospholipase L1-like esterase